MIDTKELMWDHWAARKGCEIAKPDHVVFVRLPEDTIEEKLEAARLRVHAWIDYRWMVEKMRDDYGCHIVPEVIERSAAIQVVVDDLTGWLASQTDMLAEDWDIVS